MRIPSELAEVDDDRGRAGVGHPLRRVADARLRRAHDQRPAHERGDGLVRGSRVVRRARPRRAHEAPAVQQRARDELQRLGPAEQPAGDVGRDPVADGVLLGARREAGRQAREHRRLPEELADAQQVERRARRARARPRRCARRAGARPARRPGRRPSCPPGGPRPRRRRRRAARRRRRARRTAGGGAGSRRPRPPSGAVSRSPAPRSTASAARASWISMSAHFSPIIIVVMHGLIAGRNGMIDPSATRSPWTPRTRRRGSTTASGSESGPMCAVHAGW